jgi:hypothetical protein
MTKVYTRQMAIEMLLKRNLKRKNDYRLGLIWQQSRAGGTEPIAGGIGSKLQGGIG